MRRAYNRVRVVVGAWRALPTFWSTMSNNTAAMTLAGACSRQALSTEYAPNWSSALATSRVAMERLWPHDLALRSAVRIASMAPMGSLPGLQQNCIGTSGDVRRRPAGQILQAYARFRDRMEVPVLPPLDDTGAILPARDVGPAEAAHPLSAPSGQQIGGRTVAAKCLAHVQTGVRPARSQRTSMWATAGAILALASRDAFPRGGVCVEP